MQVEKAKIENQIDIYSILFRLQPSAEKGEVKSVADLFEDATMMFINITNLEELTSNLYQIRYFCFLFS